jgi:hypothetical protein
LRRCKLGCDGAGRKKGSSPAPTRATGRAADLHTTARPNEIDPRPSSPTVLARLPGITRPSGSVNSCPRNWRRGPGRKSAHNAVSGGYRSSSSVSIIDHSALALGQDGTGPSIRMAAPRLYDRPFGGLGPPGCPTGERAGFSVQWISRATNARGGIGPGIAWRNPSPSVKAPLSGLFARGIRCEPLPSAAPPGRGSKPPRDPVQLQGRTPVQLQGRPSAGRSRRRECAGIGGETLWCERSPE